MYDWFDLFKMTIALLVVVDPLGIVPIFLSTTSGWAKFERVRAANVAALTVFIVLTATAFFGDRVLYFFGISIASFLTAGGLLLLLLAMSMLQAKQSSIRQTPEEVEEGADKHGIGVVPLGIPLLAGPGAITNVIIAAHPVEASYIDQFKLIIPILVISFIIWVVFRLSDPIAQRLGTTGINIVSRLMGLILAAMAIEFIAKGLITLFPALA